MRPERLRERFPLVQDPPFRLDGTRAFLFVLPCQPKALDALLARTFGWAAPEVSVRRGADHCILALTDTARASAADPSLGHFAYREATFFVPVRGKRNGTQPFKALHVPFIYPTEGLAVAAGREIYGLPKKQAQVEVPGFRAFWKNEAPITASTLAAKVFDGGAWAQHELFTIQARPQSPVADLADGLLGRLDGLFGPLPGRFFGQDLLQLKQVPDIATGGTPARSLYRAVTHVRASVSEIGRIRVGDPSRVRLHFEDVASEPIREVLGLAEEVTPLLATSFEMSFGFGGGEVWHEHSGSPVARPRPEQSLAPKERVLILGGGLGALSTAFELSRTEELRRKYDVRVLARGHLLGGKGASWRNRQRGDRIEEHGLHVIFGFYHNFIRQLREVYEAADRPAEVGPSSFDEAFTPQDVVVFHDGDHSYPVRFPRTPEAYGSGPKSLTQQVQFLLMLGQWFFGKGFAGLFKHTLLPGGNRVVKEIAVSVATLAKGVADDILVGRKTWEELDRLDFREWMESHKVVPGFDIANSAIMQVPYDGVFAYEGWDQSRPRLSAGMAARGLLKLATDYQRSVFYEMNAGMGEAVFAPMFEVLRARGVKVEFFAHVDEARMTGTSVEEVVYSRQAEVLAGAEGYDPLETVRGIRCWRQHPDPAQLEPESPALAEDPNHDSSHRRIGEAITLRAGADFDWVVCALPAPITARVFRSAPAGSALRTVGDIPTVATLHLQTWWSDHPRTLGENWQATLLGGFPHPLNSLQENSRLLAVEGWPLDGPKTLLYCSGPFGEGWDVDSEDPADRERAGVAARASARAFAGSHLPRIYPGAAEPGSGQLDMGRLHCPWTPEDPLADQFLSVNIDRSSRYVLPSPGTLRARPEPEGEPASNLRLAGDWTKNGIDIPCMEGACASGIRAAASIRGVSPPLLD